MGIQQEELARRSVKELVKDKTAKFTHYVDSNLWYITSDDFAFPVPIEEAKGGVFLNEHRAIRLMRWIRKRKAVVLAGGALVEEDGDG